MWCQKFTNFIIKIFAVKFLLVYVHTALYNSWDWNFGNISAELLFFEKIDCKIEYTRCKNIFNEKHHYDSTRGKKREKHLAHWSTPFHRVRPARLYSKVVHWPGHPMNSLIPSYCFSCFFPFWSNQSDIFHKCFCILFRHFFVFMFTLKFTLFFCTVS